MRFAAAVVALPALSLAACGSMQADPPAPYTPDPLGTGLRIRDVQDPSSPHYSPGKDVSVTSVTVTWVDTFDETKNGKSIGTVYIQDVGSQAPYSGISLYQPSYVPADLHPIPGDVLDFVGPYQEVKNIGTAIFPPGQTLPQLAKPVGTFRYEYQTPAPRVVPLSDLNDYVKGRPWEGMLVTVDDVYVGAVTCSPNPTCQPGDRVSYPLFAHTSDPAVANQVSISNELFDLPANIPPGTHFTSVTGIVTWFYSYHIAPRTPADLAQ
jgi:hypothetical protein